jgi:nucleotide-binding universal stress UspA family protein
MYKSILVPVDLAEADLAEPAIKAAVASRRLPAAVRLVYVRSLVPITYMEFVPADFDSEQQGDAEARLAAIAASVPLPRAGLGQGPGRLRPWRGAGRGRGQRRRSDRHRLA